MTILHKFTNRKDYTKRNKNEGRKREAEQSSKKSNKTHTHIPKIAAKWQNKRLPSFASWFVVVLLVVISAICVELRHRCPVLRSMCECVQKREREMMAHSRMMCSNAILKNILHTPPKHRIAWLWVSSRYDLKSWMTAILIVSLWFLIALVIVSLVNSPKNVLVF